MKKINNIIVGVFAWLSSLTVYAADKFEILPDLPEPLAAQASSVSTVDTASATNNIVSSSSPEPSLISVVFALLFVILLIYLTAIIYAKLNNASIKTLKKQIGDNSDSKVAVVSTTALGNNKSLHVVELGGKRFLLGASANGINLIKDLGSYPPSDLEEGEFSNIEIPNIRIPKIEIPKIEFPNLGFTKIIKKKSDDIKDDEALGEENSDDNDSFTISDIYEEGPDGIIDKLFTQDKNADSKESKENIEHVKQNSIEHSVDEDEFALYKKYL